MPSTTPICQVRVIGTTDHAAELLAYVAEQARRLLGPHITCRTQTRSARRTGQVRVYLTITRKEAIDDNDHG
jgi:hypothetical protein